MNGHHHHHANVQSYPELNNGSGSKWIKGLTQNRLGTFIGGHFAGVNLSSVLFTHRLDNAEHVKLEVYASSLNTNFIYLHSCRWSAPGLEKPTFEEAMKQKFKPAKKGDSFGPSWTNHWWKVSVKIPGYWGQYERVQCRHGYYLYVTNAQIYIVEFDPGCEAMIFDTAGTPLQGITGGFGGDRRVEYIIPMDARTKGTHDFIIESSANGMFGVPWDGDTIAPPDVRSTSSRVNLLADNKPADEQIFLSRFRRFGGTESRSVEFTLGLYDSPGNRRLFARKHVVSTQRFA